MSTIEVVAFSGGSAKMGIYSRDHCPPHATFRDAAGAWIVRITFSFRDASVALLSLYPAHASLRATAINELAQAVGRRLPECRQLWWTYQKNNPLTQAEGPCCLNNQQHAGAKIVDATYDPTACRTRIELDDKTVIVVTV
ncbi:MAG TPA: hypothetical protein VGR45_03240 [Stellaceae bacterium]|nr:hypothetical protein [Stellaceae bacterium]